jgi:hypothetical protein
LDLLNDGSLAVKTFLKATAVGIVGALCLGALAFALAPFFDAVVLYVSPARFILPATARIARAELVASMLGDGPPAGVFLILASAILFWALLFGIFYLAWAVRRRSGTNPQIAQKKSL